VRSRFPDCLPVGLTSGLRLSPDAEVPPFYFRNASLFVFPVLAVYFMWKRGWNAIRGLWLMLPFAAGAVFANVFPWNTVVVDNAPKGSDTDGRKTR